MKEQEKELTAVIETVLRETKNCDMSIETLTDYLVDRIKNKVMIEDSIILSRKEYEKLKYTWITDSDAYKKGCKEMAEKILNAQYQECKIAEQDVLKARGGNKNDDYYKGFSLGMTNTKMHIQELAKQFGVEIKEL